MGTPLGSSNYREMHDGTGEGSISPDSSTHTRIFLVDWGQMPDFYDDLLGYATLGGGSIIRVLPDEHPLFPGCFARNATYKPWGVKRLETTDHFINPPYAMLTATYEYVPFNVLADEDIEGEYDRFVEWTLEPQSEFLQLQGGTKFETTGRVLTESPGRIVHTTTITAIWHDVPAFDEDDPAYPPNSSKFDAARGRVNDSDFLGYHAGTVMFVGCSGAKMTRPRLSDGARMWTLPLQFAIKDEGFGAQGDIAGWQHLYDVQTDEWDKVLSAKTGNEIYPTADFNDLFVIDSP